MSSAAVVPATSNCAQPQASTDFIPGTHVTRERLAEKIAHNTVPATDGSDCLLWTGGCSSQGRYPSMGSGDHSKPEYLHRLLGLVKFGEIPADHDVHHECKNRACLNEAHLAIMPHVDHMRLHAAERRTMRRIVREALEQSLQTAMARISSVGQMELPCAA